MTATKAKKPADDAGYLPIGGDSFHFGAIEGDAGGRGPGQGDVAAGFARLDLSAFSGGPFSEAGAATSSAARSAFGSSSGPGPSPFDELGPAMLMPFPDLVAIDEWPLLLPAPLHDIAFG